MIGVVVGGAIATKTLYVQLNEAWAEQAAAAAEQRRLNARLMQLQMARMNAAMVAMAIQVPRTQEELIAMKLKVFMIKMGTPDPEMPPGMDPKKWLKLLENAIDWAEKMIKNMPPERT